MVIINRKSIYISGLLSEMEIIDNKIYLNEDMGLKYDERFKYDEQVYEDKEFLVNELEKIMSMKEDDIMITGHDEQIKEMSE